MAELRSLERRVAVLERQIERRRRDEEERRFWRHYWAFNMSVAVAVIVYLARLPG